jgi:hypothetical protein
VLVAAVLLRRSPMSFRSLLVMLGGLLVHVLRHGVFLAIWGSLDQRLQLSMVPNYLDGSEVRWFRSEMCNASHVPLRMFRAAADTRNDAPPSKGRPQQRLLF